MALYWLLIRDCLIELSQHKLRTLLTLLGMIFGVGAVIAMLNIGAGAEREALRQIESFGLRNLLVEQKKFDDKILKEQRRQSSGLSLSDLAAASLLPGVTNSAAELHLENSEVVSHQARTSVKVSGVSTSLFQLSYLPLASGRYWREEEDVQMGQVAVLGSQLAATLFPKGDALGQYVKVNHVWLQVIGVLQSVYGKDEQFQGLKLGGEQNQLFMPLNTLQQRFGREPLAAELSSFRLSFAQGVSTPSMAQALDHLLKTRHQQVDDYKIIVPAELMAQQARTQQIFNFVMTCVAGISLLVGGIGIMNIMLATVLERTSEIGLLRAVGATRADIRRQFMLESFVIAFGGGLLGVIFGLVLAELLGLWSGWAVAWSLQAVLLSFGICAGVGVIFGVYPAIKASELDPVAALQID